MRDSYFGFAVRA